MIFVPSASQASRTDYTRTILAVMADIESMLEAEGRHLAEENLSKTSNVTTLCAEAFRKRFTHRIPKRKGICKQAVARKIDF